MARVPFVVGGAWAVEHYVRLGRATLDLDLMIDPDVLDDAVRAFSGVGGRVLDREKMQTQMSLRSAEIDLVHHFAQGEYAVGDVGPC